MYIYSLIPNSIWSANGGPVTDTIMEDGTKGTPTESDRFIIHSIEPHISKGRWRNAAVPWGSAVRLNPQGYVEVQVYNQWKLLHNLPGWSEYYSTNPRGARVLLEKEYRNMMQQLKPKYGLSSAEHWPASWDRALPKTWVMNDFGRVAVKYFRDYNGNGRLDVNGVGGSQKEEILGDFMHTSPFSEVALMLDKTLTSKQNIALSTSHGCIHIEPALMQKWVAQQVLKVGATLEVHPYSTVRVRPSFVRSKGKLGVEIHFFPGAKSIALYRVTAKQTGHALH